MLTYGLVGALSIVGAIGMLAAVGSQVGENDRSGQTASATSSPFTQEPATSEAIPVATVHPIAAVAEPANCARSISYGQTVACAIDGAGDVEQHDFTGAPGEHVYARVVRLSGDPALVPSVSVLDSEGSPACPDVKDCVLEVAGRHTLVVQDGFLKQATGEYALYLQRRNDPLGCGELSVGEAVEGTLEPSGSMGCAIFSAGAGDRVRINAVGTGPELQFAEVSVLPADGGGSACPFQENCQLDDSGRYIVLAASSYIFNHTGPYRITVTCLADPCRDG